MESNLSASDIALLNDRNNNGFWGGGDSSFLWIFALLILAGGGFNGWGNNGFNNAIGYENLATSNEVQRGFDNQNIQAQTRDILGAVTNGTAQSVAAVNQAKYDAIENSKDIQTQLAMQIGDIKTSEASMLAQLNSCCGDTKMMIADAGAQLSLQAANNKYENSLGFANANAAIAQNRYEAAMNTAAINANTTAQTQKILDAIQTNKIESLQNQVNALQLQNAVAGVVRYPSATTYYAGTNPYFGACNCANM